MSMSRRIVRSHWLLLLAILAALPAAPGCCPAKPPIRESTGSNVDGERLISKMKERYTTCRTYEDSGKVTVIITSKNSTRSFSSRGAFTTGFDRVSGGFMFEYKDIAGGSTEGRLWRRTSNARPGSLGQSWLRLNGELREQPELTGAIQTFAGLSHDTSRLVPLMLLGLQESFRQSAVQLQGRQLAGGISCFYLVASGDEPTAIWISEADYSLRRIAMRRTLQATPDDIQMALALLPPDVSEEERATFIKDRSEPFSAETTIEYVPAFDRPLESSLFESTTSSMPLELTTTLALEE